MNNKGIEGAIKKYVEDTYGYKIGMILDRLEERGFYSDANDIDIDNYLGAIEGLKDEIREEEGIMKNSCYDEIVTEMVSTVAWEYAGLVYDGDRVVYRP